MPTGRTNNKILRNIVHTFDEVPVKLLFSEFVGTALLILCGLSIVIINFGYKTPVAHWIPSIVISQILTGFIFGSIGATIAFSPVGQLSGAHINPSVSFAFFLEKKIHFKLFVGYTLAQLSGAVIGSLPLLFFGDMGQHIDYAATQVGSSGVIAAIAGEAAATFCLIMVIFLLIGSHTLRRFTPLAIPPLFAILIPLEANLSGTSTNLARSLGPALIANYWSNFYVYIVGPFLGVILAVGVRKLKIFKSFEVEVAKIYRFSKDPYHVLGRSSFD
jgi:aquaporin Z